ncbi:hypothetical protein DY245_32040 [Streptomyces inhibens]|uniref:Uncharacterized protein n=1 Tax=Streptomyces inhibens TaxID=2293571 RepID=A0A371PVI0_STRIH|nr:hypothetical protein [Streptomyces inhibens]REK86486.1 hypothetical protein DY245_32040 [Streptomyces inhibens]
MNGSRPQVKVKSFDIPKSMVWEAFQQVKVNVKANVKANKGAHCCSEPVRGALSEVRTDRRHFS